MLIQARGVVLEYYCFVSAVEDQAGKFLNFREFQQATGLFELESTNDSFEAMLEQGEIWDKKREAEVRVGYVYECAKANGYILTVEMALREGYTMEVIDRLNISDSPWWLDPLKFVFGGQWFNKSQRISYGICYAFDLFKPSINIDYDFLVQKTFATDYIIKQALEIRVAEISNGTQ